LYRHQDWLTTTTLRADQPETLRQQHPGQNPPHCQGPNGWEEEAHSACDHQWSLDTVVVVVVVVVEIFNIVARRKKVRKKKKQLHQDKLTPITHLPKFP